jgi:hypothetical protein
VNGDDMFFTTSPAPPAPQATTVRAGDLTATGATLNGVVNPEGADTLYWFSYGTTRDNEQGTDLRDAGSGTTQEAVSETISGLTPGTTYHFQLSAVGNDVAYGDDVTFTTAAASTAPAPAVVTKPASGVGWLKAQLNGSVNPKGSATTYYFAYGKTTGYGSSTAHKSAGAGTSIKNVSAALSGLTRHTLYHFRIVAVNAHGTSFGVDRTFRTG